MGKTIIFCADGTWNGPINPNEEDADAKDEGRTNVFKLFANLYATKPADPNAIEQERDLLTADGQPAGIAKYLHGVGDSNNPIMRVLGGTMGAGLVSRVVRGYTFISRNYNPGDGDDIIITGFSRGAYTARALAGLIAAKGVMRLSQEQWADKETPYELGAAVWFDYQAAKQPAGGGGWFAHVAAGAVSLITDLRSLLTKAPTNNLPVDRIRAVGVWDTVGAMGLPIIKGGQRIDVFKFADNTLSPKVQNGFHAISIDEQRVDFTPSIWAPDAHVEQVLFPGAHSDVGGGYPLPQPGAEPRRNECGLSDRGLQWMMEKLASCDVVFDPAPAYPPKPDPAGMAHQPWLDTPYVKGPRKFTIADGLKVDGSVDAREKAGPVGVDPRVQQGKHYFPTNLP